MNNPLEGMTSELWKCLPISRKKELRDNSGLSPQLLGLEGWRVEVLDAPNEKPRRFIVGKSTGWRPCHLEIKTRRSFGGDPARMEYHHVRRVEKVR